MGPTALRPSTHARLRRSASASTSKVRRVLAAKRLRLAAFSVAHVPSGYARSLRPCETCFSRRQNIANVTCRGTGTSRGGQS